MLFIIIVLQNNLAFPDFIFEFLFKHFAIFLEYSFLAAWFFENLFHKLLEKNTNVKNKFSYTYKHQI